MSGKRKDVGGPKSSPYKDRCPDNEIGNTARMFRLSTLDRQQCSPPRQSPPAADDTNASVSTQGNFQVIRNNVSPRRRIILIIKCQNRFQILSDIADDEDNEGVRFVEDSIMRGQLTEFCARAPATRRRFCNPGGVRTAERHQSPGCGGAPSSRHHCLLHPCRYKRRPENQIGRAPR